MKKIITQRLQITFIVSIQQTVNRYYSSASISSVYTIGVAYIGKVVELAKVGEWCGNGYSSNLIIASCECNVTINLSKRKAKEFFKPHR